MPRRVPDLDLDVARAAEPRRDPFDRAPHVGRARGIGADRGNRDELGELAEVSRLVRGQELQDAIGHQAPTSSGVLSSLIASDVTMRRTQSSAGAIAPPFEDARVRANRWAAGIIRRIRAGRLRLDPAAVTARHRDANGRRFPGDLAAVELLNLLRPTVAAAVYVTQCAHALHAHPAWHERIAAGDDEACPRFHEAGS